MRKKHKVFIIVSLIILLLVSKEMPVEPMNGQSPMMRYELKSKCNHFNNQNFLLSVISPPINSLFLILRTTFSSLFQRKLSLSGDIETNPGPPRNFKYLLTLFKKNNRSLKFFHLNAQSSRKKRSTLENMINDLGPNTIFGV